MASLTGRKRATHVPRNTPIGPQDHRCVDETPARDKRLTVKPPPSDQEGGGEEYKIG